MLCILNKCIQAWHLLHNWYLEHCHRSDHILKCNLRAFNLLYHTAKKVVEENIGDELLQKGQLSLYWHFWSPEKYYLIFKNSKGCLSGSVGWASDSSFPLKSGSHGSWDPALCRVPHSARSLLEILSLPLHPFALERMSVRTLSLSLSKINK